MVVYSERILTKIIMHNFVHYKYLRSQHYTHLLTVDELDSI